MNPTIIHVHRNSRCKNKVHDQLIEFITLLATMRRNYVYVIEDEVRSHEATISLNVLRQGEATIIENEVVVKNKEC